MRMRLETVLSTSQVNKMGNLDPLLYIFLELFYGS